MGRVNLLEEIYSAQQHRTKKHPPQEEEAKELEQVVDRVRTYLADNHHQLLSNSILDKQVKEQVEVILADYISQNLIHIPGFTYEQLVEHISKEICGFGPLDPLLADDSITEIMINNYQEIYIEKEGRIIQTQVSFHSDEQLTHIVRKILAPIGRNLDLAEPYVDARLPGGSRVNAVVSPIALNGTSVSIRKFSKIDFDEAKLVGNGTCSSEMVDFLKLAVRGKANILVIGGTGSGKTSTLKFMTGFIADHERLITIEDVEELRLKNNNPHKHVISLEARRSKESPISIYDLLVNALRMRPDRIIVGEVRGREALEMIEAMNTGHEGSMSTLHANGPREAIKRLTLMIMRCGLEVDPQLITELICDTVDLIVHQKRITQDGSRKIVQITEVRGYKGGQPCLEDLFQFGQHFSTGNSIASANPLISHLQTGFISHTLKEKFLHHGIPLNQLVPYSAEGRN